MQHCELVQAGEIQAIIGDCAREGAGGPQYCGVWSLTSVHRVFNAFGNSYAGLIPGPIRGRRPVLERVDEQECALVLPASETHPSEVRATYRVRAPHYLDHELTFTDQRDAVGAGPFREVGWCSYMNCPEDPRLHFLSEGEWFRYIPPEHGVGSNVAPSYVPDAELEVFPEPRQWRWDRIARRFDQPCYYGRLGEMVLLYVFDTPRWLRFYCSPSGGSASLLPGRSCPAWDFEWLIPRAAYAPGREYRLRMRAVYKRFVSDEDILDEVRRAQDELGFERVE